MYGKIVASKTNEVVISIEVVGEKALVVAKSSQGYTKVLATITKTEEYADNFQIVLDKNVKVVSEVACEVVAD